LALPVEGKLRPGDVVAAVRIRNEGFAAICGPFDRAVDLFRRPGAHHVLGVEVDLRAEAAAYVGRDHAHLVLGQPKHESGHEQPLDVRVLAGDIKRVAVVGARVGGVRGARLDGVGDEPVVEEFERGDMRRAQEGLVHRRLVAEAPDVTGVVRRDVVHDRRAFFARVAHAHHCRQLFVLNLDQLRGVPSLLVGLRDDDGDVVADIARFPLSETGVRRLLHRLAADVGDEPAARQAVDFRPGKIVAGEDGENPGCLERLVLLDRFDLRVSVGRAYEMRMGLPRQRDVVGVVARTREKTVVLFALDRSADKGRRHV